MSKVKPWINLICLSVFSGAATGFLINLNNPDNSIRAIGIMVICLGVKAWFVDEK